MAASLLIMVSGITARSKKHEASRPELLKQQKSLVQLRDDLVTLAAEDAASYDLVMESMRRGKQNPGKSSEDAVQDALLKAAKVPMATAEECLRILNISIKIAELGTKSATSDVGVAVLLATAGFKGAAMNVRINTKYISDKDAVEALERDLGPLERKAEDAAVNALALLSKGG